MSVWSLCPLGYEHELDLLEIRFAEQDAVVDHFVVCESRTTYSGREKPWHFQPSRARWAPWRDKIIRILVDDEPDWSVEPYQHFGVRSHWQRENHQRRALGRAFERVPLKPDDVVCISDLDEILRERTFRDYFELGTRSLVHPQLPMHRHFLNLRWQDRLGISIARLCRGDLLLDLALDVEAVRQLPIYSEWPVPYWNVYSDGRYDLALWGWHFSWMGGKRAVIEKLTLAAHPEELDAMRASGRTIDESLDHGLDLQGEHRRLYWVPDSYLPEHARDERFAHLRCTPERATVGEQVQTYEPDYYWRG